MLRSEPEDPQDPLRDFPQALITPHIAGETDLTLAGTVDYVAHVVRAWDGGGKPDSIVNHPPHPRKRFASPR